jgi:hypothetical protein
VRTEIVHGASDIKSLSLPVLVRRAITKIVRDRNGFVIAGGNYNFQLPSEKHTDRFLRISNILVDFAEISFIAIGLLPFVSREVSTAYVDTSSLFPVVSAVSDHLRSFDKSRALIGPHGVVRW